jgi:hypothetical protein
MDKQIHAGKVMASLNALLGKSKESGEGVPIPVATFMTNAFKLFLTGMTQAFQQIILKG